MATLVSHPLTVTEWRRQVRRLFDTVKRWSEGAGWSAMESTTFVSESRTLEDQVPLLTITLPGGEMITLTPITMRGGHGHGKVEMAAIPTFNRVRLISRDGRWDVMTDSNVRLRGTWSARLFVDLAEELVGN